jgi:putative acetyltransferase
MSAIAIRPDDLTGEDVRVLLALHLAGMQAGSPPESVQALDLRGLQAPNITVWTARMEGRLAGVGALKLLSPTAGEVKSMRTAPDFLRRGVGAALLEHLIAQAKQAGMTCLSLETGSGEAFEPALALYRKRGFQHGEPFGDYVPSAFNQFLHLSL